MVKKGALMPQSLEPKPKMGRELRQMLDGEKWLDDVTDLALGYVASACKGDLGLALDAIQMRPRPAWVAEFLGPA